MTLYNEGRLPITTYGAFNVLCARRIEIMMDKGGGGICFDQIT